jgi:single-strand DNA-binding protein
MADGLNKVMLIGNLGADPEMRYTANGSAVTNFRMAVSRRFKSAEGERREEVEWFTVVAWNQLAEQVGQNLRKGRKVYVEGRLATRSWDGPDGQKRYRTEVIANQVLYLDPAGVAALPEEAGGDVDPEDLPFD